MILKIYIPYHIKRKELLLRAIRDIERQKVPKSSNIQIFIEVIANKNAERTNPFLNRTNKYSLGYKYFGNIQSASEARNMALKNNITRTYSIFDVFTSHDYDDLYSSEYSLYTLLYPFIKNPQTGLSFGNVILSYPENKQLTSLQLYKNLKTFDQFVPIQKTNNMIDKIIEYISRTYFFPTQATIYKKSIALAIGGFPRLKSMEDRIFTIQYLLRLKQSNYNIHYFNKTILNYIQHHNSESVINQRKGIREKTKKSIREWFSAYVKNNSDNSDIYSFLELVTS